MNMTASGLCMGCMSTLGEYIVCPHCGYDNSAPYDKKYRRPGSVVGGRYIVGRLIRKNGEGALYVGFDNSLQCRVWIREYFPHTLAERDPRTGDILPLNGYGAQYKALLSDFIDVCNEVKRLGVTEPVVPIENTVAEHCTVYAVYKDLGLSSLETWLTKRGGKLPVKEARELLLPLFNALSNIHARSDIHRGISPYTVYVDKGGNLYLWDFCMSATRTGGSELEAELFNGYSAPEQYASNGWQGTWTDVYGAAALFYRVVSGFVPPKSTLIGEARPLAPLIDLVMDLPKNISDAVNAAMNPSTEQRTQEIGAFVASLVHTELGSTAVYDSSIANEVKRVRREKKERKAENRRRGLYIVVGMFCTVLLLVGAMYVIMTTYFPDIINPGTNVMSPGHSDNSDISAGSESEEETSSEPEPDNSIPSFVGLRAEEVQADAAYAGRFEFEIQEDYNDQYEKGVVYDQSPDAGVTVQDGRTVILRVSRGKLIIKMPELVGLTRQEARDTLAFYAEDGGIDLPYNEFERYVLDPEIDPGTVVSTTPRAGEEFDPTDTRIHIFYMPEESSEDESSGSGSSGSSSSGDEVVPPREED